MTYDVIIIGAGLAGCSAAIQLANQGWKVLLLEQQSYPVHKLCGEFLSVEVLSIFEKLGILDSVLRAGAHPIRRVLLTTSTGQYFESHLPGVALGLSRYQLDWMLFQQADRSGAICYDGMVVRRIEGNFAAHFSVNTSRGQFTSRMVLGAYGKRSALDSHLDRTFTQSRTPWVAFKAHYRGLDIPGTIEMHAFPGGYCGLSQIETGQINLCWLGHESILRNSQNRSLPEALSQNSVLRDRLAALTGDSAIGHHLSQVSFQLKGNFEGDICMIGDTTGMITPLCGDGMAMALRTADMVVPFVSAYLSHQLTAMAFKHQYSQAWQREFKTRLRLGRLVHNAFIQPRLAQASVSLCQRLPTIGQWLIQNTRGKPGQNTSVGDWLSSAKA